MKTKPASSSRGFNRYTRQSRNNWKRVKHSTKARHDKHIVDHQFQVGDQVWLHINKDRLKGEGKKLNPIRYGPFTILDQRLAQMLSA
jgi:hypothetical protein